jgi:hypothetical protein
MNVRVTDHRVREISITPKDAAGLIVRIMTHHETLLRLAATVTAVDSDGHYVRRLHLLGPAPERIGTVELIAEGHDEVDALRGIALEVEATTYGITLLIVPDALFEGGYPQTLYRQED